MLEMILGSRSKVKLLRLFFSDVKRQYSIEDVSRLTETSLGTVHPAVGQLVDSRILTVKKMGRSKIYSINIRHPLFPRLRDLFSMEGDVLLEIAREFGVMSNKKGIKNIILFGSVARGQVYEAGDIDILVIHTDQNAIEHLKDLALGFLSERDVVISPVFMSKKEALKRLKEFDTFLLGIVSEGKVLYGDAKWLGM